MPTDVIKKIGATNTPTTMDFSTLQSWEDASPADLTAVDERWIGECYDQGTFTAQVIISGTTVDSTRYTILRCAAGASFKDKAGVRTTALTYNASNGVTVQGSFNLLYLAQDYSQIIGIQAKSTGYAGCLNMTGAHLVAKNIIATSSITGTFVTDQATTNVYDNCLFEYAFSANTAVSLTGQMYNCTIVNTTGSAGTSNAFALPYNQGIIKNCAVFGFNTFTTGTPAAGSDYNATDLSSAVTGTHNQTSLTYSAQFTSATNDFRATSQTSGTGLHNGTPDSTNAPNDISETARDATTPYIGAWEPSAPSQSFTASPSDVPKNHGANITLTLSGTATTWAGGGSEFSISGVTGAAKVSENVTSATAATLVITTGSGTGTLTITDLDSITTTITVSTATLAVSPTTAVVSSSTGLTLTGTHTLWTTETASTLFSVSGVAGCSINTPTVTTDTSATCTLTTGASTGTLTITDNSTGATTTLSVNAVTGTITLTAPVQWQTMQRNGSNQGTFTITGTYTGGPAAKNMEASLAGSAYTALSTVPSGGNISGTVTFTVTPNTSNVQGTLTVRFRDATGITQTVANVGIGDLFMLAGQSNAVGELDALQSYSNGSGLKATAYDGANWVEGNDYIFKSGIRIQGSFWPLMATHHMNDQGVPCCFIAGAIGGRALGPDGSGTAWAWTKYRPDTGGGIGAAYAAMQTNWTGEGSDSIKAVLWYQGENDIDGSVPRATYTELLVALVNNFAADLTGAPKTVAMQIGYNGDAGSGPTTAADPIKLAIADATKISPNILGMPAVYDLAVHTDGGGNALHLKSQQDAQAAADRFWAVLKSEVFGGTSGDGRGPRVASCQYSGDRTRIIVEFDKVLKTGLTFDTSMWTVSGVSVTAVAYHVTNTRAVVLTLSGAASLPITVSFGLGGVTAGKVVPLGPDFTLPGGAGTINLPAEMFKDQPAASAENIIGLSRNVVIQRTGAY